MPHLATSAILSLILSLSLLACSAPQTPTQPPTKAATSAPTPTLPSTPTPEPTDTLVPTPTQAPVPTSAATGVEMRWYPWPEIKALYGEGTGPWVTLVAADHTGKREFWLQVACWPTKSERDPQSRRLSVSLAEAITDPDTVAALRSAPLPEGYYQVDVRIDGDDVGAGGWLYEVEDGSIDAYHYTEILWATEERSEKLVDLMLSPGVTELVATVHWYDVEDRRVFTIEGADTVLLPVAEACRE